MVNIPIVTGVYKPTNITRGAQPCVHISNDMHTLCVHTGGIIHPFIENDMHLVQVDYYSCLSIWGGL